MSISEEQKALIRITEPVLEGSDRDTLIKYLEERMARGLPINPGSLPVDMRSKCYRRGIFLPPGRKKRLYKLFGIEPDEADIVIDEYLKRQYHALIRKYHPDLNPNDPLAGQKTNFIVKAYRQLMKWRKKLVCLLMTAVLVLIPWR